MMFQFEEILYFLLQVIEGNPYNRKCDVYSFGICLWEIYCCDRPYADLSYTEAASAIVHQVCFQLSDPLIVIIIILKLLCVNIHVKQTYVITTFSYTNFVLPLLCCTGFAA